MIKVAVCDDDKLVANTICDMIEKNLANEIVVDRYYNSFSLMNSYMDGIKKNLDILIMDIELGGENGIQVASSILSVYPLVKVIIISGYVKYAEDIFEANPIQFLIKPVNEEKLVKAVEKAIQTLELDKRNSITIIQKEGIFKIFLKDINYIESCGRNIYIHEGSSIRRVYYKLDDLEKALPLNFLRSHKSYVVNMDYIKEIRKEEIILQSSDTIPISRSKYTSTKAKFLNYLGDKL